MSVFLPNKAPLAYAQDLTNPEVGEGSTRIVEETLISLEQWQALQVSASQALLQNEGTLRYFEETFNVDGAYGETQTEAIVNDWEALAKTMGTSGLALAGAYSVWRARRKTYLESLRSGDSKAIEALFTEHFGETESQTNESLPGTQTTSPLPASPPPSGSQAWETWGQAQSLPVAGSTLAALFLLWRKRQLPDTSAKTKWTQYFTNFFTPAKPESYREFYRKISQSTTAQSQLAVSQALAQFETNAALPVAPTKTRSIIDYEAMNVHYRRTPNSGGQAVAKVSSLPSYDRNGKTAAVIAGLEKLWKQYYFYESQNNTTGMRVVRRQINDLIYYSNRFATNAQKVRMYNVQASSLHSFNIQKAEYETFLPSKIAYETDLTNYNTQKANMISEAKAPFSGWQNQVLAWWHKNYQSELDKNLWLTQLTLLEKQSSKNLQNHAEQETEIFKDSLLKLSQIYGADDLENLLTHQNTVPVINEVPALTTLNAEVDRLENLKNQNANWVQYRDKAFQALGYGGNYRTGYTKHTYIPRRERWEHRRTGPLDDADIRKDFETTYDRQIYSVKQQITQVKAQKLINNMATLSGATWLSEINKFDLKTPLTERFPKTIKSKTHLALQAEVVMLIKEKQEAYDLLISQEQQALQHLQSQRTLTKFHQWLNQINRYNSRGMDQRYYAMVDGWISSTKAVYQTRKNQHIEKYASLSSLEADLSKLDQAYSAAESKRQLKIIETQALIDQVPQLNKLKVFVNALQNHPHDPRAVSGKAALKKLQISQQQLINAQNALKLNDLPWTEVYVLEQKIEKSTQEIQSQTQTLASLHQSFLASPAETITNQRALNTNLALDLENNSVHQYLQSQQRAKEFYQTYGQNISVLGGLKNKLEKKLASLSYLEGKSAYVYGTAYYDYEALKNDYKKLLNNQLPDVWIKNWSWRTTTSKTERRTPVVNRNDSLLHDWYHKAATVFNNESQMSFKAQIKERETNLFEQRNIVFESQQQGVLQSLFTAKQIKDYQNLAVNQIQQKESLAVLKEAQTIATKVQQNQVASTNQALFSTPPSNKTLAVQTLNKNDITTISFSQRNETNSTTPKSIPTHYLEPLWKAYRRYNKFYEFSAFQGETLRLIQQAKAQYKRSLIADAGLPPEPAQTKTVRDYLEAPARFNQDLDKQIAVVEAGIPELKTKFAGQAYLATALKQAQAKIEALERYRKNGPEAVATYYQALTTWKQENADTLAEIDAGVTNHYADISNYTQGFWNKSEAVVAQKAAETDAANIIDTRSTAELVDQSPGGFSTEDDSAKEALNDFLKNLAQTSDTPQTLKSFNATNLAINSQTSIYENYKSKVLRSQGLTWDTHSNNRIQKLHPGIRAKTIELINRAQDELNINLRINVDGNYRNDSDQLKLYCNDKNTGICEGVAKWDNTGDWKSNAKPGESYHNYGLAIDFSDIKNNGTISHTTDWAKVAAIAQKIGFRNPLPAKDKAHFVMDFGFTTNELKERMSNGDLNDGYVALIEAVEIADNEQELQALIIENIKAGRDPYAVEVASISSLIGATLARKLLAFGNSNSIWVTKEVIKFGSLNQSILKGLITASDLPKPMLQELVEINQTILNNKASYKIWVESLGEDFEKAIINLGDFVSTGLEKINHHENEIVEATITAPNSLPYGDASALARAVYNLEDSVGSFKRIKGKALLAYNVSAEQLVDPETGLKSALYTDGTYTVLAFAGTESGLADKIADATQAFGLNTPQYEKAIELRTKLSETRIKSLTFVGQSLGGGLAAAAAAGTNIDTKIFNAAGVHPNTISSNESAFDNITHYYTRGEILNVLQTLTSLPDAPAGKTVYLGDHFNYLHYLDSNFFRKIKRVTNLHSVF